MKFSSEISKAKGVKAIDFAIIDTPREAGSPKRSVLESLNRLIADLQSKLDSKQVAKLPVAR